MRGGEGFKFLTKKKGHVHHKSKSWGKGCGIEKDLSTKKGLLGGGRDQSLELKLFLQKESNKAAQGLGRFCALRRKAI